MTALYAMDTFHSVMLSHTYISARQRRKGHRRNDALPRLFLRLLDEEHSDCTDKYKRRAAKANISAPAACVPLHIGQAEQIDTHKRNT